MPKVLFLHSWSGLFALSVVLCQLAHGAQPLPPPAPREGEVAASPVAPQRVAAPVRQQVAPVVLPPSQVHEGHEEGSQGTVNYVLTLKLDPVKGEPREWTYVTTEGDLEISSLSREGVHIDDQEIPVTVTFTANIEALAGDKYRVKLFLGRTVPFVSGFTASGSPVAGTPRTRSSVQQVQVGFSGTVVLESGKPLVVQDDDSQRVTVTLTRLTVSASA